MGANWAMRAAISARSASGLVGIGSMPRRAYSWCNSGCCNTSRIAACSRAKDRPGVPRGASPRAVGGANTASLFMYVDDARAHCARAQAAGAVITVEPKVSDYGDDYWSDLSYGAIDLEGHHWWFAERLRDPVQRAG